MPPPSHSGFSGYSGFSGASSTGGGVSGYSGYSGRSGAVGLQGPIGPQGVAGPQGQTGPMGPSGAVGLSGFSGRSGFSGTSGYSGAAGGVVGPNIAITGTLTTGMGGGTTGGIDLTGSTSGKARLTVNNNAGSGTFRLPTTTGDQTLATQADLAALRQELLGLING